MQNQKQPYYSNASATPFVVSQLTVSFVVSQLTVSTEWGFPPWGECTERQWAAKVGELLRAVGSSVQIVRIKASGDWQQVATKLMAGLSATTALRSLQFSCEGKSHTKPVLARLAKSLAATPALTRLDLGGIPVARGAAEALAACCAAMPRLQSLSLGAALVQKPEAADELLAGFAALTALTHLRVSRLEAYLVTKPTSAEALAEQLHELPRLQALELRAQERDEMSGCIVDDPELLGNALASLTALTRLSMAKVRFDSEGFDVLARSLVRMTGLQHFCASASKASDLSMRMMWEPWPMQQTAFATALAALATLQHLELRNHTLGGRALVEFAEWLPALTALSHLTLQSMNGGGAISQTLARGVALIHSLRHFCCSSVAVGDQGVAAVAKALRRHTALTCLEMAQSECTAPGAVALSGALAALPALRSLDLRGNRILDRGVLALAAAAAKSAQMKRVSMSCTKCSDAVRCFVERQMGLARINVDLGMPW
jgi:Ran GTPase-activating protein (RanGAP) involved in mRNA processing and transport